MKELPLKDIEQMSKAGSAFATPGQRVNVSPGVSGAAMGATGRRHAGANWGIPRLLRALWLKI